MFKQCKAIEELAEKYRAYRDLREQEVYLAEEEEDGGDVNLTIEDFKAEDEVHKMPQTLIRLVLFIFQEFL